MTLLYQAWCVILSHVPPTGKTTVAHIYGRILHDLGLLSKGEVMVKNPSDFVGSYLGMSETQTAAILDAAIGSVLVIYEAYGLHAVKDWDLYKVCWLEMQRPTSFYVMSTHIFIIEVSFLSSILQRNHLYFFMYSDVKTFMTRWIHVQSSTGDVRCRRCMWISCECEILEVTLHPWPWPANGAIL